MTNTACMILSPDESVLVSGLAPATSHTPCGGTSTDGSVCSRHRAHPGWHVSHDAAGRATVYWPRGPKETP